MWGEREGEFQDVLVFGPCILKDGAVPARDAEGAGQGLGYDGSSDLDTWSWRCPLMLPPFPHTCGIGQGQEVA